jgi:hypothetical protein
MWTTPHSPRGISAGSERPHRTARKEPNVTSDVKRPQGQGQSVVRKLVDILRDTLTVALLSGSLQAHPFHPGNQGGGLYPQKLRGSISAFDFPAGSLQHSKKILALPVPHF